VRIEGKLYTANMFAFTLCLLAQIHHPSATLIDRSEQLWSAAVVRPIPTDVPTLQLRIDDLTKQIGRVRTGLPVSTYIWAGIGFALALTVLIVALIIQPILTSSTGIILLVDGLGGFSLGIIALMKGVYKMNEAKERQAALIDERERLLESMKELNGNLSSQQAKSANARTPMAVVAQW
jgi:hypothetical protein